MVSAFRLERWVCTQCKEQHIWESDAQKCCKSKIKDTCSICGCGIPERWYRDKCSKCIDVQDALQAEPINFADFEKLENQCLYDPANGEYHQDFEAMMEHFDDDPDEDDLCNGYVFLTHKSKLRLSADAVLDSIAENLGYEDAYCDIDYKEELQQFCQQWEAKQTAVSYRPDWKKILIFNQLKFDLFIESRREHSFLDRELGISHCYRKAKLAELEASAPKHEGDFENV